MKKLLAIFFLLPLVCFGQLVITSPTNAFNTAGVGAIVSPTLTNGRLYILYVGVSNSGGTAATASVTGTGQTWTQLGSSTNTSGDKRIQVFHYAATSTTTSNISFSYTGTQDGSWVQLYEITGCPMTGTNGSDALVQYIPSEGTSTDPSISGMNPLQARAAVIAGFINNSNPFTGTVEAGWTEDIDDGFSTPTIGGYTMHRLNTTDNTPTVTAASSDWIGVAIEIKSSGRRIFNIQ